MNLLQGQRTTRQQVTERSHLFLQRDVLASGRPPILAIVTAHRREHPARLFRSLPEFEEHQGAGTSADEDAYLLQCFMCCLGVTSYVAVVLPSLPSLAAPLHHHAPSGPVPLCP